MSSCIILRASSFEEKGASWWTESGALEMSQEMTTELSNSHFMSLYFPLSFYALLFEKLSVEMLKAWLVIQQHSVLPRIKINNPFLHVYLFISYKSFERHWRFLKSHLSLCWYIP